MHNNFYYDETGHSRKINYQTVTASNYYDNSLKEISEAVKQLEKVNK